MDTVTVVYASAHDGAVHVSVPEEVKN
jgi:hypothetical protein